MLVENNHLPIFRKTGVKKDQLDQLKKVLQNAINELDTRSQSQTNVTELQGLVNDNIVAINDNLIAIQDNQSLISTLNAGILDNAQQVANLITGKADISLVNSLQGDLDIYSSHVDILGGEAEHKSINIKYEGTEIVAFSVREALDKLQQTITALDTGNVSEGSNKYYTEARVSANVDVAGNTGARHTHSNKTVLDNIQEALTTVLLASLQDKYTQAQITTFLSGKADTHAHPYRADNWVPSYAQVTGKPTEFVPSAGSGYYRSNSWVPSWLDVTGKPSTFTPSAHSHVEAEISNLDKYTKSEVDNLIASVSSNIKQKDPVATFGDIATTYPTPEDGWTVFVTDEGKTYTYNETDTQWVVTGSGEVPLATQSVDGKMSSADKLKLDNIEANANNYSHPATHAPSVIAQDVNNRFVTDAEKTAWNAKAGGVHNHDTLYRAIGWVPSWGDVTGKPSEFNPSSHGHNASEIVEDILHRFVSDAEKSIWNGKADAHSHPYAADNHNHNAEYAALGHNHDSVYALIHSHPYAPTTHNHDADYNNYSHPTGAGNNHIPSGGAGGQFLKYSASGVAIWDTPSYIPKLTNEEVQDIIGNMLSGNTESGITVTYQDGDGTIDFSVAAQSWGTITGKPSTFTPSTHSHDNLDDGTVTLPSSWTPSGDHFEATVTLSGVTVLADDDFTIIPVLTSKANKDLLASADLFPEVIRVSDTQVKFKAGADVDISAISANVDVIRG